MPVDMDAVNAIAKRRETLSSSRTAPLSLGSRYRGVHTGLLGDVGLLLLLSGEAHHDG